MLDSIKLVGNILLDSTGHTYIPSSNLDVLYNELAWEIGMIPVKEGYMHPIGILKEVFHGCQPYSHKDLVGIDEVQGLDHGY